MTGDLERQLRREERRRAIWREWREFWKTLERLVESGLISREQARRRFEVGP